MELQLTDVHVSTINYIYGNVHVHSGALIGSDSDEDGDGEVIHKLR